jgi:hypothetical protein
VLKSQRQAASEIKDNFTIQDTFYSSSLSFSTLPLVFLYLFSLFKNLTTQERKNIEKQRSFKNIIA